MNETGKNGRTSKVYGTPEQLALLLLAILQIIEREPDSSYADAQVRAVARRLAGAIYERLFSTYGPDESRRG
jgi:hypothetical protein